MAWNAMELYWVVLGCVVLVAEKMDRMVVCRW